MTNKTEQEIKAILESTKVCQCVDDYVCVVCESIFKVISLLQKEHEMMDRRTAEQYSAIINDAQQRLIQKEKEA